MLKNTHYTTSNDPTLPNYMALLACILHKKLSVSKALILMELKTEGGEEE